jgi:hypothetical protein
VQLARLAHDLPQRAHDEVVRMRTDAAGLDEVQERRVD